MHSYLSRPLPCCSFLSVCLFCCGVPWTLQCRGFGLSILMLFSFISSEIYPLNTNWGIHGHKLHRDYHSLFECFSFFWSQHYDSSACCYIDCNSQFLVSGQILAKQISRRQRRFDTDSVCLHTEKYIGGISDYSALQREVWNSYLQYSRLLFYVTAPLQCWPSEL